MTGHIRINRPASAAIAAVLAFTATPLLAQDATPSVAPLPDVMVPPPIVQEAAGTPAPPVPTASSPSVDFTPGQPVVQSTPTVDERIAAAQAASAAEAARPTAARVTERRQPAQPPARQAAAGNPAAAGSAVPPPANLAPAPTRAAAAADARPALTAPIAPAEPARTASEPARIDQALLWAMGGGALLLLGIGGTALARRRRHDGAATGFETAHDAAPAASQEPVATARPAMAPLALGGATAPASLAAMVAAAPDADNPFRTHAKRLRRARYLLAQREAAAAPRPAPQTTHAEPAPAAPVDRGQTVYRFGNAGASPGYLKPRTR